MALVGECIDNPVTHQRLTFIETAQSTDGKAYQMRFTMLPKATIVGGEHIHPAQTETFKCLSGTLRFTVSGRQRDLSAGDDPIAVSPGIRHDWWNPSKTESSVCICTFNPALRYEEYFETIFGLARDGKVTASGFPRFLQACAIYHGFRESVAPPQAWQRIGVAILLPPIAAAARALGYRDTYPRYRDHSSCQTGVADRVS